MRVFAIGAMGFIGWRVAVLMRDHGHDVAVLHRGEVRCARNRQRRPDIMSKP
ncbi:MAG TPA: hypothetical protein VE175_02785 [Woeseiaceae bacterium]|nr:hypothetical protein [Woeseiaceae bacterium]